MLSSTLFHTFSCHSEAAHKSWRYTDHFSILFALFGTYVSLICGTFSCFPVSTYIPTNIIPLSFRIQTYQKIIVFFSNGNWSIFWLWCYSSHGWCFTNVWAAGILAKYPWTFSFTLSSILPFHLLIGLGFKEVLNLGLSLQRWNRQLCHLSPEELGCSFTSHDFPKNCLQDPWIFWELLIRFVCVSVPCEFFVKLIHI